MYGRTKLRKKIFGSARFRLMVCTAVVMFAGCAQMPVGTSEAMLQGPADTAHASASHSWIKPGAASGDLLYVGGYVGSNEGMTYIFSYPAGQLVGSLDVGTAGMCSDSKGDVFLTNENAVIEYAHGGTAPIQKLTIPGATTSYCSVDPTTGDLAVTFLCPPCQGQELAIFPDAHGTPTRYADPGTTFYACGYDDQGDLFIDGFTSQQLALVELPKGSSTFTPITLTKNIGDPGQVQWDGKYITVQDENSPGSIYRIEVSGSTGTVVGTTKFHLCCLKFIRGTNQSWIADGAVTFPYGTHGDRSDDIGTWKYPRGGKPMKTIKKLGGPDASFNGVTVSVAPSS
jgi:hypothetical protein